MTFEPYVFNGHASQPPNMMAGKSNGFGASGGSGLHRSNADHFQQFAMIDSTNGNSAAAAAAAAGASSSTLKGMNGRMYSSAIDTPSVPINRSIPFAGTQKRPAHLRMNND